MTQCAHPLRAHTVFGRPKRTHHHVHRRIADYVKARGDAHLRAADQMIDAGVVVKVQRSARRRLVGVRRTKTGRSGAKGPIDEQIPARTMGTKFAHHLQPARRRVLSPVEDDVRQGRISGKCHEAGRVVRARDVGASHLVDNGDALRGGMSQHGALRLGPLRRSDQPQSRTTHRVMCVHRHDPTRVEASQGLYPRDRCQKCSADQCRMRIDAGEVHH
ncbi:unannotated protein [freshwater metagenome]|uniref:Unannotated protein n=1 Tax=freshwater metagenome TaxID=449393 RepID=A0A6J7KSE9_9ZZZZ